MTKCPACGESFKLQDYASLAGHFYGLAEKNDVAHVMWLNRFITRKKTDKDTLVDLLSDFFSLRDTTLSKWIRKRFIDMFYGSRPHAFVVALQHPSRATLLGYVIEHQHFLRQWVRSCSYIMAKTDQVDATVYELENINTEFGGYGPDRPSHYELLLRMGESLGVSRVKILETPPLPDTKNCLESWNEISRDSHWVETMAAMHGLELIADRTLKSDGATMSYFGPSILKTDEVSEATKNFLREGYEADVGHSKEALDLVEKYSSRESSLVENVQATFLRSINIFHSYLMARLERAEQFSS
ncbi:MAG: C2H2 type zinc finger domain-containing protein [Nitrososphaerales archaeon]